MQGYATSCKVMLHYARSCNIMQGHAKSRHATSCKVSHTPAWVTLLSCRDISPVFRLFQAVIERWFPATVPSLSQAVEKRWFSTTTPTSPQTPEKAWIQTKRRDSRVKLTKLVCDLPCMTLRDVTLHDLAWRCMTLALHDFKIIYHSHTGFGYSYINKLP